MSKFEMVCEESDGWDCDEELAKAYAEMAMLAWESTLDDLKYPAYVFMSKTGRIAKANEMHDLRSRFLAHCMIGGFKGSFKELELHMIQEGMLDNLYVTGLGYDTTLEREYLDSFSCQTV